MSGANEPGADDSPRIALVTRRLWPLTGEAERSVLQLADGLREAGARPTLVTPRWQKQWAERTTLRGIPIVRLPWPATPGWGLLRYLFSLSRYLRHHRQELDAVVVQGLRGEAYCALASMAPSGPPVILRASEAGPYGEVAWQQHTRFGQRIADKCRQAAAIVVPSPFVADELRAVGYAAEQIQVIPSPVTVQPAPRSEESRESARHAVAQVNHDLHVVGGAPVALCISPLQRDRGLEMMIRSWLPIQLRWPHARLWIIGDGPERENLFRLICDLDLRYRVTIPGSFDHWEDLMQAADLAIVPSPQPMSSAFLRESLAAGLTVIASDQAEHRSLVRHEQNGWLYSLTDRRSLTEALTRLIENPDLARQLGNTARAESAPQDLCEAVWLQRFLAAQAQRG
jgi:glycosyltransferase involved in cell wall biosynthesis